MSEDQTLDWLEEHQAKVKAWGENAELRAERDALRARLAEVERENGYLQAYKATLESENEAREQQLAEAAPIIAAVASAAWYEEHHDGDVWCHGCGVQLYSLRPGDDFTSTHRTECIVLAALKLQAEHAAAQPSGEATCPRCGWKNASGVENCGDCMRPLPKPSGDGGE